MNRDIMEIMQAFTQMTDEEQAVALAVWGLIHRAEKEE